MSPELYIIGMAIAAVIMIVLAIVSFRISSDGEISIHEVAWFMGVIFFASFFWPATLFIVLGYLLLSGITSLLNIGKKRS